MMLDTLLTGASVLDGTGSDPQRWDVGLIGGRIAYVGPAKASAVPAAGEVVDLPGMVLAPGFIDIHTHSDLSILVGPAAESKVLQGVTTDVTGNCGYSAFPVVAHRRQMLEDHLTGIGGEALPDSFVNLDAYARRFAESAATINVAALVGHSALRVAALAQPYGEVDAEGLVTMQRLLEECLEQGAIGMSTGLAQPPSGMAARAEIEALAQVCARYGRLYATHVRVASHYEDSYEEALDVARNSGVRLQVSHLAINDPPSWGRAADLLARFEAARDQGVDVRFDVYPYDASSSAAMQYLPDWVGAGGSVDLQRNAADPAWRRSALPAIAQGWYGHIPWFWDRIVLSGAPGHEDVVGLGFDEIAERWSVPPEQVLLDLCVELGTKAQVVLHYRVDEDVQAFLAHPMSIIGSDGLARSLAPEADHPHPRSFGTFPRVLGRYVRELGSLSLADAVHKMTGAPAQQLGLRDRGIIAVGYVADLVAFDPAVVRDQATFEQPRIAPIGVERTIVAGQLVALNGQVLPARPGRFLRCA